MESYGCEEAYATMLEFLAARAALYLIMSVGRLVGRSGYGVEIVTLVDLYWPLLTHGDPC